MRMHENLIGIPFKYEHCWEIMIKNPKWCTKGLTKTNGPSRPQLHNSDSLAIDTTFINLGDDFVKSQNINADGIERPQGRKGSKEKKRRLNDEKGVVDALNKLQCTLEK
ncbi:glutathione S-transferase T2-like [Forsythia ovata]|uniref:Glutathione S-transferase T2-like n=1 Tax=Forsythia ovata TaxID=205694 RepID=A0ABD1RIL8_9LAMI